MSEPEFTIAGSEETEARRREVQFVLNIVEPDPAYQPLLVTDAASLLDVVGAGPEEIARRMDAHFGCHVDVDVCLPVWRLVDELKCVRPEWPDG